VNRTEVLERLESLNNLQVRNIDHNPGTRVRVAGSRVEIRPSQHARAIPISPEGGVESMAKFAGLPADVAQRISPQTFGAVATEMLAYKKDYGLVIEDGQVVDFGKPRQERIDPQRVVSTIEKAIGNDVDFHKLRMLPNHVANLEVVGVEEKPVVRGDLVRAGAAVTFSPIGGIQPSVEAYVLRLICTNGVTSNTVLREFKFGGEGDSIWQWFRHSVRDAYRAVGPIVDQFQKMGYEAIAPEDRPLLLEGLIKSSRLPAEAAEAVRALALQEPPQNSYQMANLLTYASSHLLEDPVNVRRTQRAAAAYMAETEHRRICPTCHRQR